MWLLRRAAAPLKLYEHWHEVSRVVSVKSDITSHYATNRAGICRVENEILFAAYSCGRHFGGKCGYCSGAGTVKGNRNYVPEDSELRLSSIAEEQNGREEEFFSEIENLESVGERKHSSEIKPKGFEKLLSAIRGSQTGDVFHVCYKWAENGNKLSEQGVSKIIRSLCNRQLYWKALKFSEWLGTSKQIDLTEAYYASHICCISRCHSVNEVEKYIENIPKSFRGVVVYTELLKCYVRALKRTKAEAVFEKMSELDFPITIDAYNLMILLYKRVDKEGIGTILSTMAENKVKPSVLTYRLLVDSRGESGDISGMENLVEAMKADGFQPDVVVLAAMAKHYISSGNKEEAERVLEKIEGAKEEDIMQTRRILFHLYASLGRDDKVSQLWKDCKSELEVFVCIAAIEAYGKLSKVEEAEAVFDNMCKKWKLSGWHYSPLLKVYVENNLPRKAENLVKQMKKNGCFIGPITWDILVKLYIETGEIEKADSILLDVGKQKARRPLFRSYIALMEQYSKRADVVNAEKLFERIKECYPVTIKVFELLAQAYINAKIPAYGFRDRMRANNSFPNAAFSEKLAQLDPFRIRTADLE